ncbi:hypothetical protein HGA89_07945 [bacterium]|nr:hypothetical protein [bacterium]
MRKVELPPLRIVESGRFGTGSVSQLEFPSGVKREFHGTQRTLWRHRINEGSFFEDIHGLGYEVIAISPAFEHVALRQADRFIDTGQLNEFEWAVAGMTGARLVAAFGAVSVPARDLICRTHLVL